LVKIIKLDGETCKGRIANATEEEVTLDCCTVAYSDIKRAIIEIEFNKVNKKESK
jgi:hypothetical protein